MFSYLHNIRPSNRRAAVASFTPAPSTGVSRQYQEPSVTTRDGHGSPPFQDDHSSNSSSPFSVSADPPVIPPITRVAYSHEASLPKETGARSPRLAMEQVERKYSDHKESLTRTSELLPGGNFATVPVVDTYHDTEGRQLQNPQFSVHGSSQPLQEQKPNLQSGARPQPKGNQSFIPPPDRPPPPPPVDHAKPEKFEKPIGFHQARHGKTKLNLLNPMSILSRRKLSQSASQASSDKHSQTKGSDKPALGLSDDYDPRIRGNIIHDFSAPQTGRTYSSNNVNSLSREKAQTWRTMEKNQSMPSSDPKSLLLDEESPISAERQHTPVFKEHFDDDITPSNSSSIARESLKPSAYMYQVALKESSLEPEPDLSSLPPFARNLASKLSKATEAADQTLVSKGSLEVVHEMTLSDETSSSLPSKTSSPVSPPKVRSRASSNADSPFQPGGMPKRFKSNASRFSFDMAGVGSSAQEKILEERHRQKAKDKARASDASTASQGDDYWNEEESGTYSGYNSMDDDMDFEESVPGVNADAEKGSETVSSHNIHDLQVLPPITSSPSDLASKSNLGIDRIDKSNGKPGHATYRSTTDLWPNPLKQRKLDDPLNDTKTVLLSGQGGGLGIAASPSDHAHPSPPEREKEKKYMAPLAGIPRHYDYQDDDDLYFDDGMIEDVDIRDDEAFDESVFDDDTSKIYGLPLRDLRQSDADGHKGDLSSDHTGTQSHDVNTQNTAIPGTDAEGLEVPQNLLQQASNSSSVGSSPENRNSFRQASGLTQDNLAAYHDALAFAANQAAMNGEFTRSENVAERKPVENEPSAEITTDGNRNYEVHGLPTKFDFQDPDDFDYDDALSDDPIIAAANAEALENDDEGFYGREFGFFARASGTGEYANGGYFGPPGVEGIGRSHSGRVNFQEPSLTPITERSEWSNRNSAISLALHGYSQPAQQSMSSPGLAQLADMMSLEEDDLSFSALMKLRRSAWGGSTTSLPSSPTNGSQLNLPSPMVPGLATNTTNLTLSSNIRSSTHSLNSSNSFNSTDSDASPSSPTITLPAHMIPKKAATSSSESPSNKSSVPHSTSESTVPSMRPRNAHQAEQAKGHHRKSSGAETVSYTHEEDGGTGGGGRWVIEKRRVSEGGKVEVLGREVIEGGRI